MITLLKTAKKERSAAYKAMKSDAGKGALLGGTALGSIGAVSGATGGGYKFGPRGSVVGGAIGGSFGGAVGGSLGAGWGAADGYIGQKVLGGEFDDSYTGAIKRNAIGGAITGTGLGLLNEGPRGAISGSAIGAIGGGLRGTVGKGMKDALTSGSKKKKED